MVMVYTPPPGPIKKLLATPLPVPLAKGVKRSREQMSPQYLKRIAAPDSSHLSMHIYTSFIFMVRWGTSSYVLSMILNGFYKI